MSRRPPFCNKRHCEELEDYGICQQGSRCQATEDGKLFKQFFEPERTMSVKYLRELLAEFHLLDQVDRERKATGKINWKRLIHEASIQGQRHG